MANEDKISTDNKAIDVKPLGNLITIYLSGEIGAPENYLGAFEAIRHAQETDIIKFNINSPGGDLFTTIQFLRAIAECKGMVVASAEGACMSAATMIFLSADRYEISEHSLFMFHNYSGFSFGKGGEMYDQLTKERKWSEKIIRRLYEGFLTPEEIRSILDNKDIWMDGEEVMKRLERKVKEIMSKKKKPAKAPTKKATKKTTS
jgi:ATP-dependent protease ClpP protease subunit